ncbi:MAG: GtrA family protein [Candidatus Heimdallarchaeaceae archaeon]
MDKVSMIIYKTACFVHPKIGSLYKWKFRLWNFMLVGALGTITQWIWFNLFRLIIPIEFLAFIAAVLCQFMINYQLNKIWVFRNENQRDSA